MYSFLSRQECVLASLKRCWLYNLFFCLSSTPFVCFSFIFSVYFVLSFCVHCHFYFYFIYFLLHWRLITLQHCGGFCQTLTWISHGCTCVPHPDPPFLFPPYPVLQGHPSAPALSTLSHASNLGWWSISHMIIYMFQCYSFKASSPSPTESNSLFFTSVSLLLSHI